MLVEPCIQNFPGKIGELSPSSYSTPTGKQPRVRPWTRWSNYNSVLAWSRLGVEPAELSEIAVDREVFGVLLGLLPSDSPQRKTGHENE